MADDFGEVRHVRKERRTITGVESNRPCRSDIRHGGRKLNRCRIRECVDGGKANSGAIGHDEFCSCVERVALRSGELDKAIFWVSIHVSGRADRYSRKRRHRDIFLNIEDSLARSREYRTSFKDKATAAFVDATVHRVIGDHATIAVGEGHWDDCRASGGNDDLRVDRVGQVAIAAVNLQHRLLAIGLAVHEHILLEDTVGRSADDRARLIHELTSIHESARAGSQKYLLRAEFENGIGLHREGRPTSGGANTRRVVNQKATTCFKGRIGIDRARRWISKALRLIRSDTNRHEITWVHGSACLHHEFGIEVSIL